MRFLYDENLPPRLMRSLERVFPGSIHVREVGLQAADDEVVWSYAREHELTICSKDADFHQRSFLYGHPPKVVWIRRGNCSTCEIEDLLRASSTVLAEFERSEHDSFLSLE